MEGRRQAQLPAPLAAVLDEALGALAVEVRAAVILQFLVCWDRGEVAETLGIPPGEAAFLVESGAAMLGDHLRRHGWVVPAGGLGALLAALSVPEPSTDLEERIIRRFERYFW